MRSRAPRWFRFQFAAVMPLLFLLLIPVAGYTGLPLSTVTLRVHKALAVKVSIVAQMEPLRIRGLVMSRPRIAPSAGAHSRDRWFQPGYGAIPSHGRCTA
jgi:hypothetical protein